MCFPCPMIPREKKRMSKNRYDLVLYDLDGTLTDSIPLIMDSFRHAFEGFPELPPRDNDELMSYIGKPLETSFGMYDDETAKALFDRYIEYNHARLYEGALELFDGILDSLNEVKSLGAKQGIVTSKRKIAAMITIEQTGMDKIMDVYIFADDHCRPKPEGDPVLLAARRMGIFDMSRVLYVGDALPDIQCARNAGCDFAFVAWSKMPESEKQEILALEPDHILEVPEDLSCIIRVAEL